MKQKEKYVNLNLLLKRAFQEYKTHGGWCAHFVDQAICKLKGPGPLYLSTRIKAHVTTFKFYQSCLRVSGMHATMYLCMSKDILWEVSPTFMWVSWMKLSFPGLLSKYLYPLEFLPNWNLTNTRCVCVYVVLATLDLALVDRASICLPLLPGC